MTQDLYSSFLRAAFDAALAGGQILKKYWAQKIDVQQKSFSWDLVTQADKESEEAVLAILKQRFPDHSTLCEETGAHHLPNTEYLWIVDPLDGTTNYTHQYPMVCVSIGLVYRNVPIVAVVYNPIHDELFHAVAGKGAFLNQSPIAVSSVNRLEQSLLATGFAYHRTQTTDNNYSEFCRLTNLTQGVRRGGAAALDLAYVAAGRLDGFWEQGLQPWDMAAGALLVTEAGGSVSAYDNAPFDLYEGIVIATNGKIHSDLVKEIDSVRKK